MWESVIDLERRAATFAQVLNVEEAQSVLVGEGAFLERFVKDAVSAPQNSLVIDAVRKADCRAKGFLICILLSRLAVPARAAPIISIRTQNASSTGVRKSRIHRGKAILRFSGGQV